VNLQPLGSHYLLVEPIGQGGMGVVWRARDLETGHLRAIKVLQPQLAADPGAVSRFVRERTALVTFRHPNVVTLYDMIVEGEHLALVMDLVAGGDLAAYRRSAGGRLAPGEASELTAQICDGLAAAHAAGIVHRDLKPANVLLDGGRVKLADFGIARVAGETMLTTSGLVMGTAAYLAPEVINDQQPSAACDVYAVGVTLYELLAGEPPFTGHVAAIMHGHLATTPARPSGVPDRLWELIAACLSKDPEARPSAATLASAFRNLAPPGHATQSAAAAATGLRELHQRIVTPDPSLADPESATLAAGGLAGAVPRELLAPLSGFAGRAVGSQTPPSPEILAEKQKGRRLPGNRHVALAAAIVLLVAGGVAGGILATRPRAGSPGRGPTASGSATPSGTGITSAILTLRATITGPPDAADHEIAYSPDGTMLVTYGAAGDGDAIVWNAVTGAFIANLPFGTGVSDVAFSPDSQTVAVAERYGGVGLWSVADHSVIYNLTDTSIATGVAFSPDGNRLAVADGSGVRMLDVATRTWGATLTVPGGAAGLRTVLFTPSGNALAAAGSTTGYVYVWDVSTGALIGTITPPANDPPGLGTWIGYSATTGLLAIGSSGDGNTFPGVRFWAVQSRKLVSTLHYPGVGGVNGIAYDPADGARLAVVGMNGKVFVWEMPAGKRLADPLDPGGAEIADVAFSPNGKTLAVLDVNDRMFLWSVSGAG
jgi:Protein kinase domain